jgi:hypothetical protein
LKVVQNQNRVLNTLLASSVGSQREQSLAPRLLAKSAGSRLLADNRGSLPTSSTSSSNIVPSGSENKTSGDFSYDDYYEYDEDETSDKNDLGEEDDYLDDYVEPMDRVIEGLEPIRKLGMCPKIIQCNQSRDLQFSCHFDTDCPVDEKCCETDCGKHACNKPMSGKMREIEENTCTAMSARF